MFAKGFMGEGFIHIDFEAIQKEGYDITVPVICTNSNSFTNIYTYDKEQKKITL